MHYITKKVLYKVTKKPITGEDEYYGYLIFYNPEMKDDEIISGYIQWDYDKDTPHDFDYNLHDTIEDAIRFHEIDGYYTKTPGDHNGPIGFIFCYDHGTKLQRIFPPPRIAVVQYHPDNIYTMLLLDRYGTEVHEKFLIEPLDSCSYDLPSDNEGTSDSN